MPLAPQPPLQPMPPADGLCRARVRENERREKARLEAEEAEEQARILAGAKVRREAMGFRSHDQRVPQGVLDLADARRREALLLREDFQRS